MGGNISGGDFPGGDSPGGSLIGGNFPRGRFPDMRKILKCTCIDIDLHLHSSNLKPPCLVPNNNNFFLDGVEIFLHPLVQLIGYVSIIIGYIEM